MIQGGIGADMTMEGAAAGEDIGENSGPQAVMEAEMRKSADDISNEYSLVQDEPVLISDILEQNVDGESEVQPRLGAGIGIDGEVIQISRGQNGSQEREVFGADCDQVLQLMAEGIADKDSTKLTEAMNYKNSLEYSEEDANLTLKLYGDLFADEDAELSWKCISLTGWSRSNIYRLTDENRDLLVIVSETPEGLKITEPVLERTQWLYEQIGEQDFTLVDMIYDQENEAIEFLVELHEDNELRSFVWKETESL